MKETICTVIGVAGAGIASFFGGWNAALATLIIFMTADYITGLAVAYYGKSEKTENGGLDSSVGWKGLCKKGIILVFVLIGYRLDLVLGTDYIRNAVIIGFMANELISIVENAGLLGVPLPDVITKAIEILQRKEDNDSGN